MIDALCLSPNVCIHRLGGLQLRLSRFFRSVPQILMIVPIGAVVFPRSASRPFICSESSKHLPIFAMVFTAFGLLLFSSFFASINGVG